MREPAHIFVGSLANPVRVCLPDGHQAPLHVRKIHRPYLRDMMVNENQPEVRSTVLSDWTPEMQQAIEWALDEDLGEGDHTTRSSVPADVRREGVILAKESGIVAGVEVAQRVFGTVDPRLVVEVERGDGSAVSPGDVVMRIRGQATSILMGERLALNFMQRMSGIATRTAAVVDRLAGTGCDVLDTRKTTPGIRAFEKWAVRIGGGVNHRIGLYDMILIKDNHVDYAGSMTAALEGVAQYLAAENLQALPVVVEVRDAQEAEEALAASDRLVRLDGRPLVDRLLLDNHSPAEAADAVKRFGGRIALEASGGITLDNVRAYGEAGVNFVSLGALTHSVPSLDLSLKSSDLKD